MNLLIGLVILLAMLALIPGSNGGYYYYINPTLKIQDAADAAKSGDTINLAAGTYYENVKIDKSLVIKGAGAGKTTVNGNQAGTVFTIGELNNNADVTLSNLDITAGNSTDYGGGIYNQAKLTVKDSTIYGNTAYVGGGGIYNGEKGDLNLIGDSFNQNTAKAHSTDPYSLGGGIYNLGILTMTNDRLYWNKADNGGAIYNFGWANINATMIMTDCTINNNTARFNGGAIYNDGIFTLNSGSIDRNEAMYGGGIFNYGTVNQNGGNIDFNRAITGIDPRQPWVFGGYGGGVFNDDNYGAYNLSGGSINNNIAENSGGGVYNSGHLNINGGSISYNYALNGGGVMSDDEAPCIFTMNNGSISYNVADRIGGGILNYGPLVLKGGIISYNQALTGYGGGVMADWGSQLVAFDGTGIKILDNKAYYPVSQSSWYKGWGIYFGDTTPITTGGFSPATQVTSNTKV